AHLQTLRSFGDPAQIGSQPQAPLIRASDGLLYGTTYGAGNTFAGTVFKMNLEGGGYTVLYKLKATDGDARHPNAGQVGGKDGTGYTNLHSFNEADGARPRAELIEASDHLFYGTASIGGTEGAGTVFKLSKDGSNFALLYSFSTSGGDGQHPYTALLEGSDGI